MDLYELDENNEEIIISNDQEQVMMAWENPYMEASIDYLSPKGHVLEVGFGCGYSASQIMKYPIESYTIIECNPTIIEKIKEWREKYQHKKIPIEIIEGQWQEKLAPLGLFDEIYFDDFPLNISKESSQLDIAISKKRINIFIDLCIQNHTKIDSKISFYMSNNNASLSLSSDSEPFIKKEFKEIEISISNLCKYRNLEEQKCTIPLITKIESYSFEVAQRYAREKLSDAFFRGELAPPAPPPSPLPAPRPEPSSPSGLIRGGSPLPLPLPLPFTICLNMIVKNESDIIIDTLENLCSYIKFDYWVISDTGSTDNTREIIQEFFDKRGISGELIDSEWRDFAHNRTVGLDAAYNKTDYLFLFDADDRITGDFKIPDDLTKDRNLCHFGTNTFKYVRANLISNRKHWKFKGVLHEYLTNIDSINGEEIIKGDYHIEIGTFGSRCQNPNKYFDDAKILEKAFEDENEDRHLKNRYAFYCAQSYKDAEMPNESIEWYAKVLELENWSQEKYYSCLQLGKLHFQLNENNNAVSVLSKASEYDPERIECATVLMGYFFHNGSHMLVNALYNKFKNYDFENKETKLFLDTGYWILFEYYNSISAYYVCDKKGGYESCKKLLINKKEVQIIGKNLLFYFEELERENDSNSIYDMLYVINNLLHDKVYDNTTKTYLLKVWEKLYSKL